MPLSVSQGSMVVLLLAPKTQHIFWSLTPCMSYLFPVTRRMCQGTQCLSLYGTVWVPNVSSTITHCLQFFPFSPLLSWALLLFSAWCWKVGECQPYQRATLIQGMEEAYGDTKVQACQGWIHQSRQYFPWCVATENIICDGNEVLWSDPHWTDDRL